MKRKFNLTFLAVAALGCTLFGQNLITNPSAESGASTGWTIVLEGDTMENCYDNSDWRIIENGNGFPNAQDGSYYFYCGCENDSLWYAGDKIGELQQDIDVSEYSDAIDTGSASFTFSGYLQTWSNGGGNDAGRFKVEYRDQEGSVLSAYDSGEETSVNTWTEYSDTRNAPEGTRTIRIILSSYIYQSVSVDAYFDNLSLIYNDVVSVNITEESREFGEFHPNPTHNGLVSLRYSSPQSGNLLIEIADLSGKPVKAQEEFVYEGSNKIPLDLSVLDKGMYLVRMSQGQMHGTKKLIIK